MKSDQILGLGLLLFVCISGYLVLNPDIGTSIKDAINDKQKPIKTENPARNRNENRSESRNDNRIDKRIENKGEQTFVFTNEENQTQDETNVDNQVVDLKQVVLDRAVIGIKAYREADYQDPDYEGYNYLQIFAEEFRKTEVLEKAAAQLKEVRAKKLIRVVNDLKPIRIAITGRRATVDFEVFETVSERGVSKNQIYKAILTLENDGASWLVGDIKLEM